MIKLIAACAIGAALAGGLTFIGTSVISGASSTTEPVTEPLYNYGER
ncbi:hypothetical protein [Marinitenerispora sediminis]|nr:hypothetical protein [Marinitenerispora sediminis]